MNLDASGATNSVVVRLFYLKEKTAFSRLTFEMANSGQSDKDLLGEEVIGSSEVTAVPGITKTDFVDVPKGTRYMGVVGYFRKPDPQAWRYLVSVDTLKDANKMFSFRAQDCYMVVNHVQPELIPGQIQNARPECGYTINAPVYAPRSSTPAKPTPTTTPTTQPAPTKTTPSKPATPSKPTKIAPPQPPAPPTPPPPPAPPAPPKWP